jgi:outer membrane lipoprotein-sorting protein
MLRPYKNATFSEEGQMVQKSLLIGLIWAVMLTITPTPRADEQADALLKEVVEATQAVESLTAEVVTVQKVGEQEYKSEGTAKLKKPNFARVELKGARARIIASDGKTVWNYIVASNQYTKLNADPAGRVALPDPLRFFLNAASIPQPANVKTAISGKETVGGEEFVVVEAMREIQQLSVRTKFYVASDKLIRRVTQEVRREDKVVSWTETTLKNVTVGARLTDADFAYEPPKDAKPAAIRALPIQPQPGAATPRPPLLDVGKDSPDFSLPMPGGGQLSLSDVRKEKKAVLVNFWFYN